jgi:hypothetical protein
MFDYASADLTLSRNPWVETPPEYSGGGMAVIDGGGGLVSNRPMPGIGWK